jgi:hypothetical protein
VRCFAQRLLALVVLQLEGELVVLVDRLLVELPVTRSVK